MKACLNAMRRVCAVVIAATAMAGATAKAAPTAQANVWPTKPVRVLVPFGAGGVADILIRPIAEKLSRYNAQPFVIDNRPGAGGNLGAGIVARAGADGYQLLFVPGSVVTMNPSLYRNVPFDAGSFAPVSLVADLAVVLVVQARNPSGSVEEFVAAAKREPGKLFFSSPGPGSSLHLAIELFNRTAGVTLQHVGYKSGGEATTAVLSSQVTGIFANLPLVVSHIRAGTLKALVVAGPSRLSQLPNVPASAESGLANFDMSSWFGLVAPAGTPRKIIDSLSAQVAQALVEPDMAWRFDEIGVRVIGSDPVRFASFMQKDRTRWERVIRAANIRLE
jgi:tripartite-type tricarboxylate transporter receptor subunit TctC